MASVLPVCGVVAPTTACPRVIFLGWPVVGSGAPERISGRTLPSAILLKVWESLPNRDSRITQQNRLCPRTQPIAFSNRCSVRCVLFGQGTFFAQIGLPPDSR